MSLNEINIYVQDKNLISIMKKILRDDVAYKFYFQYPNKDKIENDALNIFISKDMPVNKEHEYQKRLVEMAHQDYLTGLATRWYLQEYVQNIQHEENITCIYFDLDNFKEVNDTYGHQAGDRALAATAEMLQREFSDGLAARMGGDEFMIVLPGVRSLKDVQLRVNTFMKNLLDYYKSTPTMKNLSVSAGISQKVKGSTKTIDILIHESDTALYSAKKSGKNCCKIYN